MKKCIRLCLLILIIGLSGCGRTKTVPEIDDFIWEIKTVQGSKDGAVIACSPKETSLYDDAKEITLSCKAKDGRLTIQDSTNNENYSAAYRITTTGPESVIYEIKSGDITGYATTGMTTYMDESQMPTLIMSIDNYALNFQPKTETN